MNDWRSYDDVAELYERVHAPRMSEPARDLVGLVGIEPGTTLLDVGTGTGVVAQAAVEAGATVTGVDRSLGMLVVAAKERPGLRVVAGEAIDLPFRDGTFDVTTAGFVLAHFPKPETALFDMVRVLGRGGRLAVSTWLDARDAFVTAWLGLIYQIVPKELLEPSIGKAIPHHERFRRREEVEHALQDAGLTKVRTEPITYEWRYERDEFVDGMQAWATGRFARQMVGDSAWAGFMDRARAEFAARFPDPLHDRREVLLATGSKP